MNRAIAHWIKGEIAVQHYAGVVAGIVTPVKVTKGGKVNTYAIDCGVHGADCEDGDMSVIVPTATKKSIFYFEDTTPPELIEDGLRQKFRCTLTLVGWINLQQLGLSPDDNCQGCSWSYKIYSHILTLLPKNPFSIGGSCPLSAVNITFRRQLPRTSEVFNRYTFGEEHRQFRILPYDFFAIELLCTWTVNPKCIGEIPANDPFPCWPPTES